MATHDVNASTIGSEEGQNTPRASGPALANANTVTQTDVQDATPAPETDPSGQQESYHFNVAPGGAGAGAVSASRAESGLDASFRSASEVPVPLVDDLMLEDNFEQAMKMHAQTTSTPTDWAEWRRMAVIVAEGGFPHVAVLRTDAGGGFNRYLKRVRDQTNLERFGVKWKKGFATVGGPPVEPASASAVPASRAEGPDLGASRPASVSPAPVSPSQEILALGLHHCSGAVGLLMSELAAPANTETASA